MNVYEENNIIIEQLETSIQNIDLSQIEQDIACNADTNYLCKKLWDTTNSVNRYIQRLLAINEKIIAQEISLQNRIYEIKYIGGISCNIEYIDYPLNQTNHIVQSFYREIQQKYKDDIVLNIKLSLYYNPNGRILNVHSLTAEEQQKACTIEKYLYLFVLKEQLEKLLDCVKCIQINY